MGWVGVWLGVGFEANGTLCHLLCPKPNKVDFICQNFFHGQLIIYKKLHAQLHVLHVTNLFVPGPGSPVKAQSFIGIFEPLNMQQICTNHYASSSLQMDFAFNIHHSITKKYNLARTKIGRANDISYINACALLLLSILFITFPALQCIAATFCSSLDSQALTSSQKGRMSSSCGGWWSSNGNTATRC